MSNKIFETLKELHIPLTLAQCVLHKHELLICGSYQQRACYSYHTIKDEYNKLISNNNKDSNQVTLLSFGGHRKHTLVMKYTSVWSYISKKLKKSNNYNEWIPLTDNHNHPIVIGRDYDDYKGMRAVIGGSNNHLLFITYQPNNISVFDLNTFKFIKHDTLPTDSIICFHSFISNSENRQVQKMMKINEEKNKQNYHFCYYYYR
ncbi:hypothetical protein RFI_37927 [Reticulomyxa filosa]|uniref:Uncharacterized protein n=1 Tax=Reticulomyxa filosa TaxID=46433 RepID=X6LDB7_RETFI|nr:hypothetical protein RFI_37927 [Reticulomyxa filosa]|eukprot:ETN99543.1 hypothetical protein RFI_37927 [Reticulomyxa filosa]